MKNRTIANTFSNITPFEIFFGKKPSVKYLKIYGSKIFVRVPEQKIYSKWDRKADLGILVDYDNVGYRVLIGHKIVVARHVDVVENDVKLKGLDSDDDSESESISSHEDDSDDEVFHETIQHKLESQIQNQKKSSSNSNKFFDDKDNNNKVCSEIEQRKSSREKRKPDWYGQPVTSFVYINYVSANSPKTYVDAVKSNDSDLWNEAMGEELKCIEKNKTWHLVDRPKDIKVLDLKWVFTNVADGQRKARLVVRGF